MSHRAGLSLVGIMFGLTLALLAGPEAQAQAEAQVQQAQSSTAAAIDNFSFRSPLQERRFNALVENMRCPDNPERSLADSNAPAAGEMRLFVFQMLQDDRLDFEIRDAMVSRYGEEVLYQSGFIGHRLLLLAGPVVLLVLGLIAAFIVSMRKRRVAH